MSESVIKIKVDGAKAEQTLNKIDSEIKSLKANQDRLTKAFTQGSIDLERYNEVTSVYENRIRKLTSTKENLNATLGRQAGMFSKFGQAVKGAIPGLDGLEKSMRALIMNPIGAVITAIVVAFNALKDAIAGNEELQDRFNKVMAAFQPIGNLMANIMDKIAEGFVWLSEKVVEILPKLEEFAVKVIKVTKWINPLTLALKAFGVDVGKAMEKAVENTNEASKKTQELAERTTKLKKAYQDFSKEEIEHAARIEEIQDKLSNENLSYEEQKELVKEIGDTRIADAKKALKLAQDELAILEEKNNLTASSETDNEEVLAKRKEVLQREKAVTKEIRKAGNEEKKIAKDRATEQERLAKERKEKAEADRKLRLETEDAIQELKLQYLGDYEKQVKKAELDRDKTIRDLEEKRAKATSKRTKDAITEQIELVKRNFQEVVLPQIAINQLGTIIDRSDVWRELPIKIDPKEWKKRFKEKYNFEIGGDPWEDLKEGTPEYRAISRRFVELRAKEFIRRQRTLWPEKYQKAKVGGIPESVVDELYKDFSRAFPEEELTKSLKDLYEDYKRLMVKSGKEWAIISWESWLSVQEKVLNKTTYAELAEIRAETSVELLEEEYNKELRKLKSEVTKEDRKKYGEGKLFSRRLSADNILAEGLYLDKSGEFYQERLGKGSPTFTSELAKTTGQEQLDKARATFIKLVKNAEDEYAKLEKSLAELNVANITKFDELLEGNLISTEDYYKEILALDEHSREKLAEGQIALEEKRRALEYSYLLDVQKINIETAQKVSEAWASGISNYAGLLQEASNIFSELAATEGESQEKWLKFQRMSIYISEAAALANGVATAMKASNWVEALAAAASVTASLIATFNKVKSIESQAQSAKAARYATGGYISGPGSGTSDSIPARLSNGESVINQRATALYAPLLSAINQSTGGAPIMTQRNQNSLARELALAVSAQPAPVVAVSDINTGQNRVKYVRTLGKI